MSFNYEETFDLTSWTNSAHDPTIHFSGWYYQKMQEWVAAVGSDYAEMGNRIQDQSSSPYINMVLKGPNATRNASHPTAYGFWFSTYLRVTTWYDYQQVDNDANGIFSSEDTLINSNINISSSTYWGNDDAVRIYWSDTPGARHFICTQVSAQQSWGWVEINEFNPDYDYMAKNSRWAFFSSAINSYMLLMVDTDLDTLNDFYDEFSYINPGGYRWLDSNPSGRVVLKNIPVRSDSGRTIGHLGDTLLYNSGALNQYTNRVVKFGSKYYASLNKGFFVRIA